MASTLFVPDPAADLLFGKGRRELLALLFGRPEHQFYLRELARVTGASAGTSQRELRALERVGLVRAERRGNQLFFRANRASPLFDTLRTLLDQTMGAPDLLRAALAPLADRLVFAGIYGSVARGTQNSASDVDVLVVGDVEFSEISDAIAEVEKRVGRPVNPTVYTPAEFERRREEQRHFVTSILGDKLIPLIGELPPVARRMAPQRMLERIPATAEEVARLLAVADRGLADAAVTLVSTDARVGFAHGAVMAAAAAALAAEGYRAGKERHHERLLDSLRYTIGIDGRLLKQLHDVRRARNAMTYERLGDTSPEQAEATIERAHGVRGAVAAWLRSTHPDLAG